MSKSRAVLRRVAVPLALAAAVALPLGFPLAAHAWWVRGGWGGGVVVGVAPPPVFVAPPVAVYAPPPAYYAPPPPRAYWVPGHWAAGYWIRGHWA